MNIPKHVYTSLALAGMLSLSLCTSCTVLKVKTPELEATYIDIHPGGNKVDAEVDLKDLGTFKTNRGTGSAAEVVEKIGEAVNPIPFE